MHDEIKVSLTRYSDRPAWIMYFRDPVTEKLVTKSSRTTDENEARKRAGKWEEELRSSKFVANKRIAWADFRERYETEHLETLSDDAFTTTGSAFAHLERIIAPARLSSINAETLSQFKAALLAEKKAPATVACYLGHIRAALSWAVSMKLLAEVPKIMMPKQPTGTRFMKGRAITAEEHERIVAAATKVRRWDAPQWQRLLEGLWLSGLRLGEALRLSWDAEEGFAIDLTGKHPRFRICAGSQKGNRDELLPMTPDFAAFILQTPKAERFGPVFPMTNQLTGEPLQRLYVSMKISKMGAKANVIVSKAKGKPASAHDYRRAFGTRWAKRVMPPQLKQLMRHSRIETTMRFYVDHDADELAADLWERFAPVDSTNDSTVAENHAESR